MITYDFRVALELGSEICPERLERSNIRDDRTIESPKVMRVKHSICALASDVVDSGSQIGEVCWAKSSRDSGWC